MQTSSVTSSRLYSLILINELKVHNVDPFVIIRFNETNPLEIPRHRFNQKPHRNHKFKLLFTNSSTVDWPMLPEAIFVRGSVVANVDDIPALHQSATTGLARRARVFS